MFSTKQNGNTSIIVRGIKFEDAVDKGDSIGHMVSRVSNIRFSLKSRNAYDAKKPYNQLCCNKKTAQIDGGSSSL